MAQWVKVMAAKNEDLALIPGTHRVEGEPAPASYSLTPTCAPWHICLYTHKHKEIITFTKKKKKKAPRPTHVFM